MRFSSLIASDNYTRVDHTQTRRKLGVFSFAPPNRAMPVAQRRFRARADAVMRHHDPCQRSYLEPLSPFHDRVRPSTFTTTGQPQRDVQVLQMMQTT